MNNIPYRDFELIFKLYSDYFFTYLFSKLGNYFKKNFLGLHSWELSSHDENKHCPKTFSFLLYLFPYIHVLSLFKPFSPTAIEYKAG